MSAYRRIASRFALTALVLASGCATLQPTAPTPARPEPPAVASCRAWLAAVDTAVDAAQVRDAGEWRIPGFPYLRLDRFTASYAAAARGDAALFDAWVGRARALDREARRVELANLPGTARAGLPAPTLQAALERTESCAAQIEAHDRESPRFRDSVLAGSDVPGGYGAFARFVGLYPLTRLAFARGVDAWHADATEAFARFTRAGPLPGRVEYYVPSSPPASRSAVATIITGAPRDAFGIPQFTDTEQETLFAAYAPVFAVQSAGEGDRIGALAWSGERAPRVRTAKPVVYSRLAYTRFEGRVLPQLVYTAWFPERSAASPFDVLAGRLDGVVLRVTLAADGAPLVYDTIHPCGCYHMFFPTARVRPVPPPDARDEWAFSPAPAPELAAGGRLLVYVASRTHYVSGIGAYEAGSARGGITPYAFADERSLLTLPLPDGGSKSIYGPDGLVAGTERFERWLFWPMGVPSAGTMRQWGTHDTAFLGERHFDDADLIERRFRSAAP